MPFKRAHNVSQEDAQSVSDVELEFITGATHLKTSPATLPPKKRGKKSANTRWDADLLDQIDAASRRRGLSRTAWLHYACGKVLEEGGY
jgi:hypothetical protein